MDVEMSESTPLELRSGQGTMMAVAHGDSWDDLDVDEWPLETRGCMGRVRVRGRGGTGGGQLRFFH